MHLYSNTFALLCVLQDQMEKADCGGFGAAGGSWQLRRLPENVRRTPVLCMAISTTPAPGAQPHGARHRCFQVLERYTTLQCQVRKTHNTNVHTLYLKIL